MKYADEHDDAAQAVRDAGDAVTFVGDDTATAPNPLSPLGAEPAAGDTVDGWAIEVKGTDAEMEFDTGETVANQRVVLLFVPRVYGALPEPGNRVKWSGQGFTVAQRFPLRPDGTAILARVLVVR